MAREHQQEFIIEFDDKRTGKKEIFRFSNHREYLLKMGELGRLHCYTIESTKTKFIAFKSNPQIKLGF